MTLSTDNASLMPDPPTSHQIAENKIAQRSDRELQLARRIDWRFLLPEPYLRRVAYRGPASGTLPTALKHFSASFQTISAQETAEFDLVVLRLSEVTELAQASKLLATGGFLYWEMKPINWTAAIQPRFNGKRVARPKRWRHVANLFYDHVEALERLDFEDIQIHWQRPNFEGCLEIIPINEARALDYAFGRPRSDFASHVKFAAGKVMMQTGLLAHLTPCFSLIAQKK